MDDSSAGLFWFVHITDIHIQHTVKERSESFSRFCQETLPTISPEFVIASGDITHGQMRIGRSKQIASEWETYWNTLEKLNLNKPNFWLDTPGNHDARAVDSFQRLAVFCL